MIAKTLAYVAVLTTALPALMGPTTAEARNHNEVLIHHTSPTLPHPLVQSPRHVMVDIEFPDDGARAEPSSLR